MTTARGISVFIAQALLFAVTIMLLMQESIKMILHSVSAYVRDVTNIRRAAAYVLYIASGMLAFYRETGIERAKTATDPIPILVSISDSSIMGLYAQVRAASIHSPLTRKRLPMRMLSSCVSVTPVHQSFRRQLLRCSCGSRCVSPPRPHA